MNGIMDDFSGIMKRYTHWLHGQWPAGLVEKFPEVNEDGTTTVSGIRITGDLTGIPLLKFAVDSGAKAVQDILNEPDFRQKRGVAKDILDLAIVGAGVSGVSAAMEAKKADLNFQVFEAKRPFSTVIDFPKGKPIHTYPSDMTPAGDFVVSADVKEDLLDEMEQQRQKAGIDVLPERVDHLERKSEFIVVHHGDQQGQTKALRALIAIGKSGNYRKMNSPGEGLNKVQIDLIAGDKETALGDAYALQLTYPLHGREALTAILEPALTVRPATLLLPALPQKNLRQANMIYGPTQSALARAIVDALEAGRIPPTTVDDEVMIALATVHPRALDRHALYQSVHAAATQALAQAFQ